MSPIAILKKKVKFFLARNFGMYVTPSETDKVRHLVLPYCSGKGCDVGFGGNKIKRKDCDSIDLPIPYTIVGRDKLDIKCDIMNQEIPVPDNTYDYVYTSHLIEDFVDTLDGLKKFVRVLKSGGNLILVFPDQGVYEGYCKARNEPPNPHHIHAEMGMQYMLETMAKVPGIRYEQLFSSNCEIDYNVILVLKVTKI